MTHEEFQEKVKSIPDQELAEMAQKALSKLCSTGGQSFTMTVPPRIDDTDIILSEVVKRFEVLAFITAQHITVAGIFSAEFKNEKYEFYTKVI